MNLPHLPFTGRRRDDTPTPEYERGCAYCESATVRKDGTVTCRRRGRRVRPDAVCSAFSYDLLKRKPRKMSLPEIDPDALDN